MGRPSGRIDAQYVLRPPMGGMNTRTYPTEIPDSDYVLLRNIEATSKLGIFATRNGTAAYNEALIDANPIRSGIRWYYGASNKQMLVTSGTSIWLGDDVLGTFSLVKTGFADMSDWFFGGYLDYLYMVNGADGPQRWDGSTMRRAGFPAPTTGLTATPGGAGALTGTYGYAYTFVYDGNSAHESSMSAVATANPAAQVVALASIDVGAVDSGVTARNIYRTRANGSEYYFLHTIPNNTDTTYTDNAVDTALGLNQGPTDNGLPPNAAKFIVFWHGRMVVARTPTYPQRVFLSAITNTEESPGGGGLTIHGAGAEIFPASHFIDVGDNNGRITGLAVLNDQLIVFKEDQIFVVSGDDAQDMTVYIAQAATGCIAPKTIVNMRSQLLFLGRSDGVPEVYSFDGAQAQSVSLPIEPTLIADAEVTGDDTYLTPCAGRYKGQYILAYPKLSDAPNWEVMVLDTRPPAPRWVMWRELAPACFIPWNGRGDAGEFYYGDATEGRVLRMDVGEFGYPSTNLNTRVETKWLDLGAPFQLKQLRYIDIYGKALMGQSITLERRFDLQTSGGTTAGAAAIPLAASITGHKLFMKRIACGGSDATIPEFGYLVQLILTAVGQVEIHRIVVHYTVEVPELTHNDTA